MAAQILLVRRDDFSSDIESLSLWNYTAGFSITVDGWAPARSIPSDQSVTETLTLQTKGTSPDNLAANLQALDTMLQKVNWFNNPQEQYGVWLRVQQPRETGARQALVKSARLDPVPLWSHTAQDGAGGTATYNYGNFVGSYGLALERTPYWESDAAIGFPIGGAQTALSTVGGTSSVGISVSGDLPARLAMVNFYGQNGGGGPLSQFWVGFRSARFGTAANFVPTWNLHLASFKQSSSAAGGGTATVTADAAAKDGTAVVCGFTDSALSRRITCKVVDISASNYADQRGTFLVLLRAKLSGAGQVNVRLVDGLYTSPTFATRDRVAVTGTNYAFYELGTVKIPTPGRLVNAAVEIQAYALGLDAERAAGTPTLSVDCLVMIPVDEGWLAASIDGSDGVSGVQYVGGDDRHLFVTDRADGQRDSTWHVSNVPQIIGVPRGSGGMPVGATDIIVLAAQRQTGATTFNSVLADVVNVQEGIYERWVTARGAAT